MAKQNLQRTAALLKLGDRVKIRHYAGKPGRIVELRGPLGPGGIQVYRVLVRRKPKPSYIELREDQLEVAPAKRQVSPKSTPKKPVDESDKVE